jgi:hypothetical protein
VWWFINETVVQFFLSVFPSRSQSTSIPEGKRPLPTVVATITSELKAGVFGSAMLGNEYIDKPLLRKRNTGRIVEFPQQRDTLFNGYSTVLNG